MCKKVLTISAIFGLLSLEPSFATDSFLGTQEVPTITTPPTQDILQSIQSNTETNTQTTIEEFGEIITGQVLTGAGAGATETGGSGYAIAFGEGETIFVNSDGTATLVDDNNGVDTVETLTEEALIQLLEGMELEVLENGEVIAIAGSDSFTSPEEEANVVVVVVAPENTEAENVVMIEETQIENQEEAAGGTGAVVAAGGAAAAGDDQDGNDTSVSSVSSNGNEDSVSSVSTSDVDNDSDNNDEECTGNKVLCGIKDAGDDIKDAAHDVKDGIKDAVHDVGSGIKNAVKGLFGHD